MAKPRTQLRTIEKLNKDRLWPQAGISPDVEESRRHLAVYEVLTTIPDEAYGALKAQVDCFAWFIPHVEIHGKVDRWPAQVYPRKQKGRIGEAPYVDVLYLSPMLEMRPFYLVLAVVAHELAHLASKHSLLCDADLYDKQEREAWELVDRWGYEREHRLHQQWHAKREREEQEQVQALTRRTRE